MAQSVTVGHMITDHLLASLSLLIVIFKVRSAYAVVPVVTRFSCLVVDGIHLVKKNSACLNVRGKRNSNHFDHKSNIFTYANIFI